MLDRQLMRTRPEEVKQGATRKGINVPIEQWVLLDQKYREHLSKLESERAELNKQSKLVGQYFQEGKKEDAETAKVQTKELKEKIESLETKVKQAEKVLIELELQIPNLPQPDVPNGTSAEENHIVRQWGEKPTLQTKPTPHWETAERLKLIDFERASKISGSGFAVYTGLGARLQRALLSFMIDHQTLKAGYQEVYPPYLVVRNCLVGTGSLPKLEGDFYETNDDLYLIPTAEVPLTNLYREEILDASMLTLKMAAATGCFRREAGAAGKDTRGILRVHQFDKVELLKYSLPEKSNEELELLVQDAETILQMLGIHYRVALLCAGEMGFGNTKQYDLEIWAPGVQKFLEISSCSNFESFQARRANIRFRRGQGEKPEFVHTLNGSGLATPRLFATLLETYLQPDGSVIIPDVLRPYVGTDRIVSP